MFIKLFEERARCMPHRVAVKFDDNMITYGQLNARANALANALTACGISCADVIGVYLEKDIQFLIVILAIFKLGGCYLPLDIEDESGRTRYMIDHSRARIVICNKSRKNMLEADIPLYDLSAHEERYEDQGPAIFVEPEDIAYILYTSGTTGKPKGAMIEQQGMLNHLLSKIETFDIDESSVIAQTASPCFDISIWQFLSPLIVGGQVVIYSNRLVLNVQALVSALCEDKVTILELVPSYLITFVNTIKKRGLTIRTLRSIISTGEKLTTTLATQLMKQFPDVQIANAYGPTEAADDVCHYIISELPVEDSFIPIGTAIRNMRIYVVNEDGGLCDVDEKGEIWVSGLGVGRGYIHNEEMTIKYFSIDPFTNNDDRLYKTGDIGSYDSNGVLYFWGRRDNQVKINGRRFELDEIEMTISNCEGIRDVCVVLLLRGMYLCYTTDDDRDIDLPLYFKQHFPSYMAPMHYIKYDSLPLTVNGKINRKRLTEDLCINADNNAYSQGSDVSKVIYEILNKYILVQTVFGVQDLLSIKFAILGLNSLDYIKFITDIENYFNIDIENYESFETINDLYECVNSLKN